MTIRHLKIFITVVDYKTMRKAAEVLFISQPSITQSIQELENHYNTKLFDRLNHKLYLTASGEALLIHARHVVDAFESLDLAMIKKGQTPTLKIGGSVSVGSYLLNNIIEFAETIIPNLDFNVVINNTTNIEQMILESKLDIAIVEGIVHSSQLLQIPLCDDELVIIVGQSHNLYNASIVTLESLSSEIWISREEGSIARNQYEQLFFDNNLIMNRKWICSNPDGIKNLVSKGRGLAIISKHMIQNELQNKSLKVLNVKDIKVNRKFNLIYHKDKYLIPSTEEFIKICMKGLSDNSIF